MTTLQPMTEAEQDAFFAPRRPKLNLAAAPEPLPEWETSVTITCRVCGVRDGIRIQDAGLLCRSCRLDLTAASLRVKGQITAVRTEMDEALRVWSGFLEGLGDELRARWDALYKTRLQAEMRLARAQRAKVPSHIDPMVEVEEAKAALAVVAAKIERTRASRPEIAAILEAEATYLAEMARLLKQLTAQLLALDEITAARDGATPF